MNTRLPTQRLDELEQRLDEQALRMLICLCPEIESSPASKAAACAAIQKRVACAVQSLRDDIRRLPCLAPAAFQNAVLSLALAGMEALQAMPANPNDSPQQFRKTRHVQHVHHH